MESFSIKKQFGKKNSKQSKKLPSYNSSKIGRVPPIRPFSSSYSIRVHGGDKFISKSIEEVGENQTHDDSGRVDTPNTLCKPNQQHQGLFQNNYQKIGSSRQHTEIDRELGEILNTIREQKKHIQENMEAMKTKLKHIENQRIPDTHKNVDAEVHTEQFISCIDDKVYFSMEVQTETSENVQPAKKENANDVYKKLVIMLHDMAIDSKDILPHHDPPALQPKQYKKLKGNEIIQVQKFLIKKLAQKINITK